VAPDNASRSRLALLLESAGYTVKVFRSASAFLDMAPVLAIGSVIAQVENSQREGLTIPKELKIRRIGDHRRGCQRRRSLRCRGHQGGGRRFPADPLHDEQLLDSVASVRADIQAGDEDDRDAQFARARISEMSQRERDVLIGLLGGRTNKQIAREMGISPRTVEVHRAHVMQRLGAQTLPEAVLKAAAAGLQPIT
jgi:FixJ family two-component response regulator